MIAPIDSRAGSRYAELSLTLARLDLHLSPLIVSFAASRSAVCSRDKGGPMANPAHPTTPTPPTPPTPPGALRCPNCRSPYALGATYCAVCGEPLNPNLIGELRYLYDALLALDKRIASGEGARALRQLRDELRPQYLADQAAATAPG